MSGRRVAFLVAGKTEAELRGTERDISKMEGMLTDPQVGKCGVNAEGGLIVRNSNCESREKFKLEFEGFLKKLRTDDECIFYFSGHGRVKTTIEGSQFQIRVGATDNDWLGLSGIRGDIVGIGLHRIVIIVDACYSGGADHGVLDVSHLPDIPELDGAVKGYCIIVASCGAAEKSIEDSIEKLGRFTRHFCEGLEASLYRDDLDPGQEIYLSALLEYVTYRLKQEARDYGRHQTPQCSPSMAAEKIVIGWASRDPIGRKVTIQVSKSSFLAFVASVSISWSIS